MKGWTTATLILSALFLGVLVGQGRFPPPAAAYPAGAAVSYGANPVVAKGGSLTAGSSAVLFTAPADQDVVVTDLMLTGAYTHSSYWTACAGAAITITLSTAGVTVGTAMLTYHQFYGNSWPVAEAQPMTFSSGLPIAAGEQLTLSTVVTASNSATYCDPYLSIGYIATGYYAEP